jgi:glyoxylase-like metal-dependent hydrolase (beta-lactamase superfamily II)
MPFEIDFLSVGDGSKSGDAIALRYSAENSFKVMVVDGGTQESGEKLVELVQTYYRSSHVDYVVCSHPDDDHASGLRVVLDNLSAGFPLIPVIGLGSKTEFTGLTLNRHKPP